MRTSEQINEIAGALAKSQAAFPVIKKGRTAKIPTKTGREYSYTYADLSDILEAVRPVLCMNGIALVQVIGGADQFMLTTRLMHVSGQWIETDFPLRMSGTIQEVGSELTYARRYALCGILGIAAEDDDDGAAATQKPQQRERTLPETRKVMEPPRDEEWLIKIDEAFDVREQQQQEHGDDPSFKFTKLDREKIGRGIAKKIVGYENVSGIPHDRRPEVIRKIVDGKCDHLRAAAKKEPVTA